MIDFTSAEKRLNGSFGYIEVDGDTILEANNVTIDINVDYSDVQRGMDKDSKMTGRSGEGKFKVIKAYSRAKEWVNKVKAGKAPIARLVAWVADPELDGKEERVAISKIKLTKIPVLNYEHGKFIEEEYPFKFAPGDLEYLDSIDPE